MSKLQELSKPNEKVILPHSCPICGVMTNYIYRIEEKSNSRKELTDWYRCQCGVIFQERLPTHDMYNTDYFEKYKISSQSRLHNIHGGITYAPLIEELTMGRLMLDVGFGLPWNMKYFENRGWIVWGIDNNETIRPGGNIYKGDFMSYDFFIKMTEKQRTLSGINKIKDRTFDLIWMSHVFEHFDNPLVALRKAYNLLDADGVLYISTPDIDFIFKTGVAEWTHWNGREYYILWSEQALKREVERLGFKVIMSRRNFTGRYISWYDIHMICQKHWF